MVSTNPHGFLRCILSTGALCLALAAQAQSPADSSSQPEPQVSPQAAYDEAMRPFDMTRRAPQNWSEVELNALKVSRENAKSACAARNADQFAGDDLIALARLCAFALDWEATHRAASAYIAAAQGSSHSPASALVHLTMAFDYQTEASLNLKNLDDAIATARRMLQTVPYDQFTSEATTSTIEASRFVRTADALSLLSLRQPILLEAIRASASPQGATVDRAGAPGPLPLHVLYADAIALPALQLFINEHNAAAASYADLDAAMPRNVPVDDAAYVAAARHQYLLLGAHLPALSPMGFLLAPGASAPRDLNTWFAKASVFMLFPDWCNQCVATGYTFATRSRDFVAAYEARPFGLVAQERPPVRRPEEGTKKVPLALKDARAALAQSQPLHVDQQLALRSNPDSLLEGTATVVVPHETLNDFAAIDFPLLVFTDHEGIVRWMEHGSDEALAPGGDVDLVLQHIAATWPLQ